jgi:MFS family permease
MTSGNGSALPVADPRRHRFGFWAVAFAFLIVMAFATLPSPLYGLYRIRDHLSAFMVTVVYAIFAGGTIAALISVGFVVARAGRRGAMLAAVATMMAAAGLLAAWKALPGVNSRPLDNRNGGRAGRRDGHYLPDRAARPRRSERLPDSRAEHRTAVNVGALGIGPLVAGCLAEWVTHPLTLPYLLFVAVGAIALVGLASAPETGTPAPPASATSQARRSSGSVRLLIPGAVATLAAFSANGLFAGLSGLFLATTLHHPSHALSGATLFLVFSSGVAAQLATTRVRAPRVLVLGTISMLIGLALLVTAVRLSTPSLALFLLGGAARVREPSSNGPPVSCSKQPRLSTDWR